MTGKAYSWQLPPWWWELEAWLIHIMVGWEAEAEAETTFKICSIATVFC